MLRFLEGFLMGEADPGLAISNASATSCDIGRGDVGVFSRPTNLTRFVERCLGAAEGDAGGSSRADDDD